MQPDLDPQFLQNWNPYAIIMALTIILPILGGAVVWLSTGGMKTWIKFTEHRVKMRAIRIQEQQDLAAARIRENHSKKMIDQFLDSKMTNDGYRAVLRIYDQHLQDLEAVAVRKEDLIADLYDKYNNCEREHAAAKARLEAQNETIEEMCKRTCQLEDQCTALTRKLQRVDPKADPNPSPGYFTTPQSPKEFGDSNGT